jgi:hypothetical protein
MAVELPSLEEQTAREHAAYLQVERHILETDVRPRVTQAIIDEHRERPIGKHSDELERVLIYLRKHQATRGVAHRDARWHAGRATRAAARQFP